MQLEILEATHQYKTSSAYQAYLQIPPSTLEVGHTEFGDYDVDSLCYPEVYNEHGGLYVHRGPLRVIPLEASRRTRFVLIVFTAQYTPRGRGQIIRYNAMAYAWQGDHHLRLLEEPRQIAEVLSHKRENAVLASSLWRDHVPDWHLVADPCGLGM